MVSENSPEEKPNSEQPAAAEPAQAEAPSPAAAPTPPVAEVVAAESVAPMPPAGEVAASAQPAAAAPAPVAKKDMTPEQRAAAIKAAQERALKMKADRDAAKAAAEGGTAVVPADAAGAVAPAGPAWRIPAAGAGQVTIARAESAAVADVARQDRQVQTLIQRRQVLRGGVFASLGGFVILMVGSFLNLLNPRHIVGFGGIVKIPASLVPKPGDDPKKFFDAKAWVVNLKPGEGGHGAVPPSEKGGLVALYQKCVHLGCTVPWRPEFDFEGSKGWFRCPCHGSTYTKGGARVFGPAPRSLDTFDLTINPDGSLTINTGKITLGDTSDPQRGKLPA